MSAETPLLLSAVSSSCHLPHSAVWVLVPLSPCPLLYIHPPPKCMTSERTSDQVLGERHKHWLFVKRLQEAKGEILVLETMCYLTESMCTLPGLLDKAGFLKAFIISKSLPLSYNTDITIIFPTVLPSPQRKQLSLFFHALPFLLFLPWIWSHRAWKKNHCSDKKGARVGEAEDQGAGARRGVLDHMGSSVSCSFTVQLGLPMLRVANIWGNGWEWRWGIITVSHRNKRQ